MKLGKKESEIMKRRKKKSEGKKRGMIMKDREIKNGRKLGRKER